MITNITYEEGAVEKRQKYHYRGRDRDGTDVFVECVDPIDEGTIPTVVRACPPDPGLPARLGWELAEIKKVDGEHYEICPVEAGRRGPAKVVTDDYRKGWEHIWGKGGIN